ncbi:Hypothetical protein I595_2304 [Croceitalea dokdonensis DOKDO 023]|uniref:Uncharacterized protein n=1 Tax=Croceitalea dokdonensis DOKDO 023 TaxID=1300341 RepID=A0A0P7AEY5_9FLAO|nr:Hypothetical protein I595_2304 [Croceitalea dokdonensis DOKDO 023]
MDILKCNQIPRNGILGYFLGYHNKNLKLNPLIATKKTTIQ